MAESDKILSESIVTLIFNQLNETNKNNVAAVDRLTAAVNELIRATTMPPTRKDIFDKIEVVDGKSVDKFNTVYGKIETHNSSSDTRKKELETLIKDHDEDSTSELGEARKGLLDTLNRLETAISKLAESNLQASALMTTIQTKIVDTFTKVEEISTSIGTMSQQFKDLTRTLAVIFTIGLILVGLIKLGIAQFSSGN